MRIPPLLADFTHARVCKAFCEKYLTLPFALFKIIFLCFRFQHQLEPIQFTKVFLFTPVELGFSCLFDANAKGAENIFSAPF